MKKYILPVSLTLFGPFLTTSTGPESYGLQKAFHRDHQGRPVIPASHVKGKLRMALEELEQSNSPLLKIDVLQWFGKESADNSYEPIAGTLKFSDFVYQGDYQPAKRSRISINHQSLTANENQLRDVEELFRSGTVISFTGTVTFFAKNEEDARNIKNALQVGWSWLTNLGAEKSVGFGRLFKVQISEPVEQQVQLSNTSTFSQGDALHLRIKPLEPIMVGGVKTPRTNYVQSERVLPGGLIKGALASCLNRVHGVVPFHSPLAAETSEKFPQFGMLVKNFSAIRVSHAFPVHTNQPRPIRLPISTVQGEDGYKDTALSAAHYPLINDNRAPTYFVDWKTPKEFLGDANPKEVFVTRTEIDDKTRRSLENRLFTYSFLCPEDEAGQSIEWVCNVDFSGIADPVERQHTKVEFAQAVQVYLDRLGKLNQSVQVEAQDGYVSSAGATGDLIEDGRVLITLQTDTIMLNPQEVSRLSPGDDLLKLYAAFWQEMCGGQATSACLKLDDFYAHQTFKGGYLYHRYLGAAERQTKPKNYHPYYLTCAGSVFIFRVINEQEARRYLKKWLSSGLDLPAWAVKEYSQYQKPLWQNCPFVPQNGYGEITVNLKWHWDHSI